MPAEPIKTYSTMIKEETLRQVDRRVYEEPDGEYLDFVTIGNNTITVLTKVEENDSWKVGAPFEPSEFSVSDLKDELDRTTLDDNDLDQLVTLEKRGKDRKTAVTAIENER